LLPLALVACGADIDPEADRDRAETAILTEDDLPDGFEESDRADDEEADDPIGGGCVEELDEDEIEDAQTAEAQAAFEGEDGAVFIEVAVRTFEDAPTAQALVDLLDEEGLDCLADRAEETGEDGGSDIDADPAEAPEFGDVGDDSASGAIELTIDVEGAPVELDVDLYAARAGRALVGITVTRAGEAEFAGDDATELVEAVVERLQSPD
jgi:hypothetical protein